MRTFASISIVALGLAVLAAAPAAAQAPEIGRAHV